MSDPTQLRQLEGPTAASLAGLVGVFEDLQVVLRCCERLVAELGRPDAGAEQAPGNGTEPAAGDTADPVLIEALWTLALLSYARCFSSGADGVALTPADLAEAGPEEDVKKWHELLLQLREHHADPAENPRERFAVGVAQGEDGNATGVAVTSTRQPGVDDLTVRQTGAVAYALSKVVDGRIQSTQAALRAEVADTAPAELEQLDRLDVGDAGDAADRS